MRIFLFLLTNAAVLLLISVLFHLFGLGQYFYNHGLSINFENLLLSSAVIGMSGSFISLMMSKWMAKQSMGVYVIERPSNPTEQWLVETVARQAQRLGIGMPEVGMFDTPEPNAFATGMRTSRSAIGVTRGLLQTLTRSELQGVIGHEMAHVKNRDILTSSIAATIGRISFGTAT